MAVTLWAMMSLLVLGCSCSVGRIDCGCMKWNTVGQNVCCEFCHPGNRMVRECGPSLKDLCIPCEPGTFTVNPKVYSCDPCTQCVGAQVHVKDCTATRDTQCGCRDGLVCGDGSCSFCVQKCGTGHEPTEDRSCRPCPDGTFNDQGHRMCKPRRTKCPHPDQYIVAEGDAFTDSTCANVSVGLSQNPSRPGTTDQSWPLVVSVLTSVGLMGFIFIIVIISANVAMKNVQKRKTLPKLIKHKPIITTPTNEPRTLIAIECSFHEAEQEQGSSSESLDSRDSSEQLIA
uniref:Tumor necrosis factor receptor superfamily, member 9a n=2 Tax=Scophthalmus maximus TaxID=52904 RepID=A0A8D3AM27_SCOMX